MNRKIHVALADADVLCRVGLCGLLEHVDNAEVVGQASDMDDLLEILEKHQVDVVIVDYNQPKYFDYSVAAKIKEISAEVSL